MSVGLRIRRTQSEEVVARQPMPSVARLTPYLTEWTGLKPTHATVTRDSDFRIL